MGSYPTMGLQGNTLFLRLIIFSVFQLHQGIEIPRDPQNAGLPSYQPYQPEPPEKIRVKVGERRCDNFYHGHIPPCLLRPWLPAFSYSTTEGNNGEYRKRRSPRKHKFRAHY